MKNKLITLIAVGLSIGIINNNNCRPPKYNPKNASRTQVQTPQQRTPVASTTQKKLDQSTKQLADAEKEFKNAKTPEQKNISRKKALMAAQAMAGLDSAERTMTGELLGYDQEQKDAADYVATQLQTKSDVLAQVIKQTEEKYRWDEITHKGWFGNSPKPGVNVKIWEKANKKLNELKEAKAELDKTIRTQKVIAGTAWSKTRWAAWAGIAAVVTGGTATVIYGPAAVKGAAALAFSNPKAFVATAWDQMPSWRGTPKAPVTGVIPGDAAPGAQETTSRLQTIISAPGKLLGWYTDYQNMMAIVALATQAYRNATTEPAKKEAARRVVTAKNIARDMQNLQNDYKAGKISKELYDKKVAVKAKQLQQIEQAIQPQEPEDEA